MGVWGLAKVQGFAKFVKVQEFVKAQGFAKFAKVQEKVQKFAKV